MKRILLVLTLFLTLLSTTIQPSSATQKYSAKVNTVCTKVGALATDNSRTLMCTKIEKKLTWQPFVAEIELTIWRDLQKIQKAQQEVKTSLEIHKSPTVNSKLASAMIDSINSAARLWQVQYLPENPLPTLFFSEKDRAWFINEMKVMGVTSAHQLANFDNEVRRNGSRSNWAGVTGDGGRLWMTYMIGSSKKIADNMDYQIAAHEYTHLAQNAISKNGSAASTCWQIEGGAYFYGIFLGAKNEKQLNLFSKQRNIEPGFEDFPGLTKVVNPNWEKMLDKFGANYSNKPCGPNGAYAVGSLANEYLYSLKGHEGVIEFLAQTSEAGDFTSAIESVYGKTWPVIRKEIAQYIQIAIAQT